MKAILQGQIHETIGDIKTSLASLNSKWLECDGRGIYSNDYPELTSLLENKVPFYKKLDIPRTYYEDVTYSYINVSDVFCRNGTWAFVSNGYRNNQESYIPVLYYTNDLNGEWTEVRISTDSFHLQGIFYNSKWRRWVIYGYEYISSTECYPYLFYSQFIDGSWSKVKISTTPCKITTGIFENNTMLFLAKGCGNNNSSTLYSFDGYNSTQTERVISTSFSRSPKGLCWSGQYWAFTGGDAITVWYTTDITSGWTSKTIKSGNLYSEDMCYGNGTWCIVGWQSSGGSGRIFYTTDLTGNWIDVGITDPNEENDIIGYSDGVFLVTTSRMSSGNYVLFSIDNCKNWIKKEADLDKGKGLAANDGKWLIVSLYGAIVLNHPEADAVLPEITSQYGTTYIKAKS